MNYFNETPRSKGSPKILRQRRVTRVSPIGQKECHNPTSSRYIRKTADLSPEEIRERNAKERQRVHAVNDQYQKLKEILPYRTKGRRMSKETIIKLTTQYIKDLQAIIHEYDNGTLDPILLSQSGAGYSQKPQESWTRNLNSCQRQPLLCPGSFGFSSQETYTGEHYISNSSWQDNNITCANWTNDTNYFTPLSGSQQLQKISPIHPFSGCTPGEVSPSSSESSVDLSHTGYRLNLLCQTTPPQDSGDNNTELKSCLYSQPLSKGQKHYGLFTESVRNQGSRFDTICL